MLRPNPVSTGKLDDPQASGDDCPKPEPRSLKVLPVISVAE